MIIKSKEEFNALDGFNKGWIVYMRGAHKDEIYVPKTYNPIAKEDYEKGSKAAMFNVMDSEG